METSKTCKGKWYDVGGSRILCVVGGSIDVLWWLYVCGVYKVPLERKSVCVNGMECRQKHNNLTGLLNCN